MTTHFVPAIGKPKVSQLTCYVTIALVVLTSSTIHAWHSFTERHYFGDEEVIGVVASAMPRHLQGY